MEQIETAIERISLMEEYFDALLAAAENDAAGIKQDEGLEEMLTVLTDYYENGLWLHDYELDDKGLLPASLKRGILSEDGFYDLLTELDQFI